MAMLMWLNKLVKEETPKMLQWIRNNPFKSMGMALFIGSPFVDYYLNKEMIRQLEYPVYQKLVQGSKPLLAQHDRVIPRPQVLKDIKTMFFPHPIEEGDPTRFGVIIGPSGSGKTYAVRKVCQENPQGVLYFETSVPDSFVRGLCEELQMKTSPKTIMDLVLGYIYEKYTLYHVISDNQLQGIGQVFEVLRRSALRYKREFGRIPVLIIDGVDLLAKEDEPLCRQLITFAKILANTDELLIILVSSEGAIMPMLETLSQANRAVVYEVADVPDDKAMDYLISSGVAPSEAEEIVDVIGGRLVYLQTTIKLIKAWKGSDQCEKIKAIFLRKLNAQRVFMSKFHPESEAIVEELSKDGSVQPSKLISNALNKDKMEEAIKGMVSENILRYGIDGTLKWHDRIQQNELSKQ